MGGFEPEVKSWASERLRMENLRFLATSLSADGRGRNGWKRKKSAGRGRPLTDEGLCTALHQGVEGLQAGVCEHRRGPLVARVWDEHVLCVALMGIPYSPVATPRRRNEDEMDDDMPSPLEGCFGYVITASVIAAVIMFIIIFYRAKMDVDISEFTYGNDRVYSESAHSSASMYHQQARKEQ